jgi:predicted O-methyltransferase YrrM
MDDDHDRLRAALARALAARNWAEARALTAAHAVLPADLALIAAQAAWGVGAYEEALSRFRVAALADPDSLDAATRLAQAETSLGEVDAAHATVAAARARFAPAPLLDFFAAQLALDRAGPHAALEPLAAAARDSGFGEAEVALAALRVFAGLDRPSARQFGRERADARWRSTLWQHERIPPARLFGTAAALLDHAIAASTAPGLVLEFGVYFGRSIRRLPRGDDGLVHGFDSFEGLPEHWGARDARGALSTGGRLPTVPEHVRLHRGWFADTLPGFLAAHPGPVRLVHIDCDLYASTVTVLDGLAARLRAGAVLVFDDFLAYPGYEAHEFRAWHEFAARAALKSEWLGFTLVGREAALRVI